MNQFKAHPSALSKIMSYADKKPVPEGAKTYLAEWANSQFFNRERAFTSRFTDKGLGMETAAFAFLSEQRGEFYCKNYKTLENDFFVGTPDCTAPLIDLKLPFSWATFPRFVPEPPKEYFWQMQAYMHLTGAESAELVYILLDTPENLLKSEAYARARARKIDYSAELFDEVKSELTYPELSPEHRIKSYIIARDEIAIEQACARVEACREWLKKIGA
jgi:hypothetical protein